MMICKENIKNPIRVIPPRPRHSIFHVEGLVSIIYEYCQYKDKKEIYRMMRLEAPEKPIYLVRYMKYDKVKGFIHILDDRIYIQHDKDFSLGEMDVITRLLETEKEIYWQCPNCDKYTKWEYSVEKYLRKVTDNEGKNKEIIVRSFSIKVRCFYLAVGTILGGKANVGIKETPYICRCAEEKDNMVLSKCDFYFKDGDLYDFNSALNFHYEKEDGNNYIKYMIDRDLRKKVIEKKPRYPSRHDPEVDPGTIDFGEYDPAEYFG